MNGWKKATVSVLVLAITLQCVRLCVSAANMGFIRRMEDRDAVLIDVFQDPSEATDFVREFPETLFLSELEAEPPVSEPPIRKVYDDVPLFIQDAYVHALYGDGTIASCGSSMTALAMVATYLTGYEYLPDELARSFAGKAETDVARMLRAVKSLGLECEKTDQWDQILEALCEGKCAIAQMNEDSLFSENQHFIVLKGITEETITEVVNTEEGTTEEITRVEYRIFVNDPCGTNYREEMLKVGFSEGFAPSDISEALSCGWIFDPITVSEDIEWYQEVFEDANGDRYESLKLTPAEKQLLARAVYVLSCGECVEGQQALVEVLLNRLLSEDFPDELKEIVYGEEGLCHVSLLNEAELTTVEYTIVDRAIYGPYILDEAVTDFSYTCHN